MTTRTAMPPPSPDTATVTAQHDPAAEPERIDWSVAVLVFLEILVAVPLAFVLFGLGFRDVPFLFPLFVFLALRIPGDIARALAGTRPLGLAIEGPFKALSWGSLPYGLMATFGVIVGLGPLWLVGASGALFGLALWGHHARALPHALRLARVEGVTGAVFSVVGLAGASTVFADEAPWSVVVPGGVLVVGGALAARAIVRLFARTEKGRTAEGWTGWYQAHFFRLSVLVAAVIVYLFVRDSLAGVVPFLFLFEYSFAILVAAGFLWSLRAYARKQVTDQLPLGPHRRHEQAIERHGETTFDLAEGAFGRFLETGDADDVRALAKQLGEEGVRAETLLAPVVQHRDERGVLLVHPGWLYTARLLVVVLLAWSLAGAIPEIGGDIALFALAIGIYAAQWNRYGGPWPLKTGLGLLGLGILYMSLATTGTLGRLATPIGLGVVALALLLPFVHPLRAAKGKPLPRFLYQGPDPQAPTQRLIQRYDRSVLVRGAWMAALGLVAFFVVGELARLVPEAGILFSVFLAFAFAFLAYPVLVTAGLRTGRIQTKRRAERARKRREALLRNALDRLEEATVAPLGIRRMRHPR